MQGGIWRMEDGDRRPETGDRRPKNEERRTKNEDQGNEYCKHIKLPGKDVHLWTLLSCFGQIPEIVYPDNFSQVAVIQKHGLQGIMFDNMLAINIL